MNTKTSFSQMPLLQKIFTVCIVVILALQAVQIGLMTSLMVEVTKIKMLSIPSESRATVQPPTDVQGGKPFVFVGTNLSHPVVKIMQLGFWDACQKYNLKCKFMAVEGNDIAGLVAQMDTITKNNTSGISSSLYDKAFYAPTLKAIKDGIPVIHWHSIMPKDEIAGLTAWVSADVEDYGKRAALEMAKAIDCKGTVAITQGSLTSTETPAAQSFSKALKTACPNVEVLASQEEGYVVPDAIAKATAILVANPKITGAFSTTGAGPTTWAKAAQDRGKKAGDIKIISMDYSVENLDLVKAGWVHALVGQPLYEENYKAVELLLNKLQGKEVKFENPYPCPIILKTDIDKYYAIAYRAATFDALSMNK